MSSSVCQRVLALLSLVVLSADFGVLAQSHLRNDSPRRLPTTTPDSRQAESLYVDRYLKRCGYLEENGREILPEARKQAISQLQEKAGLAVTGIVDRNTLNKMVLPGCGAVTSTTPSPPPPRLFDRVLTADGHERSDDDSIGYKWSKTRLTWKLANVSPDISQSAQRRAFHDAFKLWSEVSPLTFQEVTSGHQSDITIRFTSNSHGDGFAFDGPGGEVGHAFFPENGNIHLDDDELWTDTGHGMHLTTMAAHLIGHALGLAHSQESSAIMSTDRIARGRTVGINLHHNDVSAVQRLYGQKNGQVASTTTTRSYPTRPTAGTTSPPRPTPSPSTVRPTTRQSWPIRTQPTTTETTTRRTTAGRFSTTARPTSTTRHPHHHRHSTASSTSSKLKSLDIHDPDDRRPVYPVVRPADRYSTTTRRTVPTRSTPTWRSPPTTSPRYARYTAPTTTTTTAAPTTTRYVWTRPTRGTTESTTTTRRTPPTRYRETTTTPSPPVWTTTRAVYTRYPPRTTTTTTTTTTEYTTRRTPPTRPVYTRGTPSTTTEYIRRIYLTTRRPAYTRATPSTSTTTEYTRRTAGTRPVNTRSTPPLTTKTTSYVRRTYPTTTSRPVYTRGTPSTTTTTEYVKKTQPTTTVRPVYTRSTPSTRQTWPPRTQPTTTESTTSRPFRTTRPVFSRTTPTRFPTTTITTTGPTTTSNTGAPTKPAECSARFDAVMQGQDGKVYAFYSQWVWRLNDRGVELGPVPIGRFFEDAPTDISSAVYSKLTNFVYLFKGKKIWKYQNFRLIEEIEVTNSAYPVNPKAALINLSGTIFLMKDGFYWSFDEVTQDIGARYSMWPKFSDVPTDVEAAVSLQDNYMYFFKGTSYYKFDETSGHVLPGYPKSTAGAWFGPQCNNGRVEPK